MEARRRNTASSNVPSTGSTPPSSSVDPSLSSSRAAPSTLHQHSSPENLQQLKGNYWLTRAVILRLLGFIYFIGFLIAFNQSQALIGSHGILPFPLYLEKIREFFRPNTGITNQLDGR